MTDKVLKHIDELHEHPNCTEYFHDFLNIIRHDMLLVDSQERKSCRRIAKRLWVMHVKCRRDVNYAAKTNPWNSWRLRKHDTTRSMPLELTNPVTSTQRPPARHRYAQSLPTGK